MQPQYRTEAVIHPGRERGAKIILAKKPTIFITFRFGTHSGRITAFYCADQIISTGYSGIRTDSQEIDMAFVVFLNSTIGLIQLLNIRGGALTYPRYNPKPLRTISLPDPGQINLTPITKLFDQIKDKPLSQMRNINDCPIRRQIDHIVARTIGIDPDLTDHWRHLLSLEPTISGKPHLVGNSG